MLQCWRWFGPADTVSLATARQAGARGIVTALHEQPWGGVWPDDAIAARRQLVADAGMSWAVCESIPIHPAIIQGTPDAARYIDAWCATLRALAAADVRAVCFNFIPILGWTRTDKRYLTPDGGLALRFDLVDFCAYDVCVLKRAGAAQDYDDTLVAQACERAATLDDRQVQALEDLIIAGIPGEQRPNRDDVRAAIDLYADIDKAQLRANLVTFLQAVVPVAEDCGARLCLHPDDPPQSLFGLPRVVSNADDYRALVAAVPAPANGVLLCTGSLGAAAANDLPAITDEFATRVSFAHLRNVKRENEHAFHEANHLDGDVDMVAVVATLLAEERRRREQGREDWEIPMRPDHGHLLLGDGDNDSYPGYSAIGRLKGLAELRGVMAALQHMA